MPRRGAVFFDGEKAGWIEETEQGMVFAYTPEWLADSDCPPISRTLPKQAEPHVWRGPSPFFMGLRPEGWLHRLALDKLKIAVDDWFGQILHLCRDCIGAVHVEAEDD